VETDETNETIFFIVLVVKELGHEKKRKILKIHKKCYFFIHFLFFGIIVAIRDLSWRTLRR